MYIVHSPVNLHGRSLRLQQDVPETLYAGLSPPDFSQEVVRQVLACKRLARKTGWGRLVPRRRCCMPGGGMHVTSRGGFSGWADRRPWLACTKVQRWSAHSPIRGRRITPPLALTMSHACGWGAGAAAGRADAQTPLHAPDAGCLAGCRNAWARSNVLVSVSVRCAVWGRTDCAGTGTGTEGSCHTPAFDTGNSTLPLGSRSNELDCSCRHWVCACLLACLFRTTPW